MKRRLSGLAVFLVMLLCIPVISFAAVHIHTEVTDDTDQAVKPTCTEPGLTQGSHCADCGEVIVKQETLPALGHRFGEWVTTSSATYERPAIQTRACSMCGLKETRPYGSKLERIRLNKPATPRTLNKYGGIQVSWKKVPHASYYIIARRIGSGSVKQIAQTKKLVFLDRSVKNGQTCTYYIKAVGKNKYRDSYFSVGRKMYRLARINLTYAKSTRAGTVTVRWQTNKKGQGYELVYSLKSNFSGAKVSRIGNNAKSVEVIRKLKKGKRYYIKIRAFRKVSGKMYYSCWSKTVRATVKK